MNLLKSDKIKNFFDEKLVIFFTIAISVAALLIWFFLYLVKIEKYKIKIALETESTRVEREFIERVEHTFALINSINLQILEKPQDKNHINEILKKFKTSPELVDTFSWTIFSWVNSQGFITVDAEYGILNKPFDLSARDYIPLTKSEPKKFHLGAPVFGSTSKKWMIPGGVGAVDKNGKYIGTTTIGFEINSLARSLHKAIQDNNIGFELLTFQGKEILHANSHSFGSSEDKNAPENLKIKSMLGQIKSGPENVISNISLVRNSHGFLVKKVNNFPYFLVLQYDHKAINNELWQALISRSIEIFLLFLTASFLLIFIYKREREQRQRILSLKRIVEQTSEAKTEFLLKSASEVKVFVSKIKNCAKSIKKDLEKQIKSLEKSGNLHEKNEIKKLKINFCLSSDIIDSSDELTDFITNMIDLNQAEVIELTINEGEAEADILKIAKRSVQLLQKIADNAHDSLVDKIENNLHQLALAEPNKVKQIVINLIPSENEEGKTTKVEIMINDNNGKNS